uniref:Uncharacterized protein n=1 Tax=Onchocerca volvulus TaxID=6282 RepID=A0A8R1XRW4_ONCVO
MNSLSLFSIDKQIKQTSSIYLKFVYLARDENPGSQPWSKSWLCVLRIGVKTFVYIYYSDLWVAKFLKDIDL